jgi:hypothetical protein
MVYGKNITSMDSYALGVNSIKADLTGGGNFTRMMGASNTSDVLLMANVMESGKNTIV